MVMPFFLTHHQIVDGYAEQLGEDGKLSNVGEALTAFPFAYRLIADAQFFGKCRLGHTVLLAKLGDDVSNRSAIHTLPPWFITVSIVT